MRTVVLSRPLRTWANKEASRRWKLKKAEERRERREWIARRKNAWPMSLVEYFIVAGALIFFIRWLIDGLNLPILTG